MTLRFCRTIFGTKLLTRCVLAIGSIVAAPAGVQGQDLVQIGSYRLISTAEQVAPLLQTSRGAASLASKAFLIEVGGVNFQQVADLDQASLGEVSLGYDKNAEDCRRLDLVSSIAGTYVLPICDWELKPITLYANEGNTAVVSLFGTGPEMDRYYYVSFHPAFKDTLLGLRLLQADMFLIDPAQLRQIPNVGGEMLLGAGEDVGDEQAAISAVEDISKAMESANAQSWVLTDIGISISVSNEKGRLKFSGLPYYYFWRENSEDDLSILKFQRDLIAAISKDPSTKVADDPELEAKLRQLDSEINSFKIGIVADDPTTNRLRQNYRSLLNASPTVFRAVADTARYAALFRYVKSHNRDNWGSFVSEIDSITIAPSIKTPNQIDRAQF